MPRIMATTALRHTPAPICLPLSPRTHYLQVEGSSLAQDTAVPSPEPLSSAVLLHELLLPHLTNDGVVAGAAVIARLALVCRSLKSLAHDDEAVWRPLCEAFAQRTQPSQWLDHGDHAANDGHGAPRLYRCVESRDYDAQVAMCACCVMIVPSACGACGCSKITSIRCQGVCMCGRQHASFAHAMWRPAGSCFRCCCSTLTSLVCGKHLQTVEAAAMAEYTCSHGRRGA